jgi:hypothetical protein
MIISSRTLRGMPGESGTACGEIAGAFRRQAHQAVVAHAVIAALELEDLVAAAERAGDAHGIGVRLGAAADEAHLLRAGHRIDDRRGQPDAVLVVGEERGAEWQLRLHRGNHLGMAVADEHRAGAQQEIDILVAADIPDAAAATLADDDIAGEVAETAGRQHALRQLDQRPLFVAACASGHRPHSACANAMPCVRRRDRRSPTRTASTVRVMKHTEL